MINIPPTHPNVLIFKLRLKLVYRKSIISGICKPKKPVSWDSFVWLTLPSCCHRYRNIWLHKQQPTPGEPSIQKLGQLDPNSSSSILMPLRNWVAVKILLMTAGRIFAQVKLGTLRKINCRNRFILHSKKNDSSRFSSECIWVQPSWQIRRTVANWRANSRRMETETNLLPGRSPSAGIPLDSEWKQKQWQQLKCCKCGNI